MTIGLLVSVAGLSPREMSGCLTMYTIYDLMIPFGSAGSDHMTSIMRGAEFRTRTERGGDGPGGKN